jgi:cellulose synthase/poly-beta-1,6-N-acetylglucosamine synthase-like glycosyltransferase
MSRLVIYVLANLIFAFDAVDVGVRMWLRRLNGATTPGPSLDLGLPEISDRERSVTLRSYAVIASIRNEAMEIDRIMDSLLPLKDLVWIIDDASSDTTALRLRREGWKCILGTAHRNKPAALQFLLRMLPPDIETVVVMDPDVRWIAPPGAERATLDRIISDLQRSGAAALTPRVQARPGGWLVECQAFEYELACGLGRKSLRDLCCNSGVSIYQRKALESALSRHSLSIYAEDFENSLLLLSSGKRIYYDDRLICETRAKSTLGALISQRVGWSYGCLKVVCERVSLLWSIARRSPLGSYQYLFYLLMSGIILMPIRWISVVVLAMSFLRGIDQLVLTNVMPSYSWNQPLLFVLWYCKSTILMLLVCFMALPASERRRHIAVVPFYGAYALLQYVPTTIGYLNVISLAAVGRRVYADHYASDRDPRLVGASP